MNQILNSQQQRDGLITLYYLLIHADGKVSDREIQMGEIMRKHEEIDEIDFKFYLDQASKETKALLLDRCINALQKCSHEFRVKCVAWMSLIANSDGFMDPDEWKMIYNIYANELHLDLEEILSYQKNLPRN